MIRDTAKLYRDTVEEDADGGEIDARPYGVGPQHDDFLTAAFAVLAPPLPELAAGSAGHVRVREESREVRRRLPRETLSDLPAEESPLFAQHLGRLLECDE